MGKIGKPQKSRKHKKIKSVGEYGRNRQNLAAKPKQGSRRGKPRPVNEQPRNVDDQPIPRKVHELTTGMRSIISKRKKKKKGNKHLINVPTDSLMELSDAHMSKPLRPVPKFQQRPGESRKSFLRRMDRETEDVLRQSRFEDKYNVKVEEENGQIRIIKPESAENPEKKNSKKKERLKERKERKKLKSSEDDDALDFSSLRDDVQFGEVAMEPPNLSAKPRPAKKLQQSSSKNKSLILAGMTAKAKEHKRRPGESVKRKNLSLAQQRLLDQERKRVIELYREVKKRKAVAQE